MTESIAGDAACKFDGSCSAGFADYLKQRV
jgi:hypothetical protein